MWCQDTFFLPGRQWHYVTLRRRMYISRPADKWKLVSCMWCMDLQSKGSWGWGGAAWQRHYSPALKGTLDALCPFFQALTPVTGQPHTLDRTGHVCRVSGPPQHSQQLWGRPVSTPGSHSFIHLSPSHNPSSRPNRSFLQRLGEKSGFLLAFSSFQL